MSIQEFQKNEAIDVEVELFSLVFSVSPGQVRKPRLIAASLFQVVQLISTEILPFANFIPKDFVGQIMAMLNRGSIHSQSPSFTGEPEGRRLRPFDPVLLFICSSSVGTAG